MTVETDEPNYARNLQHTQAVLQIQVNKNIPGKKHQVQFLAPVFPSANASVYRQETIDVPLFQLPRDLLFVAGTDMSGIPLGLQLNSRLGWGEHRSGRGNEIRTVRQIHRSNLRLQSQLRPLTYRASVS